MTSDGSVAAVSNEPARRSEPGETFQWRGGDGHRLPIVSWSISLNHAVASGVEANTVADAEFQHLGMRTHLLQETKPLGQPGGSGRRVQPHLACRCRSSSFAIL